MTLTLLFYVDMKTLYNMGKNCGNVTMALQKKCILIVAIL